MKLIIVKNYDEMSLEASNYVKEQLLKKPNSILGLATGGTPEKMYEILIKLNQSKEIDFSNVKTFNLDEYVGIKHSHPMSYHSYMNEKLFDHINILKENTHIPSSEGDVKNNCKIYDEMIKKEGGIDLQILGIGENAHIAFNEPGSSGEAGTSEVNLTDSTISANSRYFNSKSEVPTTAISMGIGSILKSKKIVLLASGLNKAEAIKKTFESKITEEVPSSFLQNHPDVIVIADEEAASLLKIK